MAQQNNGFWQQVGFVEGAGHQPHPAVPGPFVDREPHVAHPQPWMSALFDVALRSAEAADQEVPQPLAGSVQFLGGVHRPKNLVTRDLLVERSRKPVEAILADRFVET